MTNLAPAERKEIEKHPQIGESCLDAIEGQPMSLETTSQIIAEGAGKHFDPADVESYFQVHREFEAISEQNNMLSAAWISVVHYSKFQKW